MSRIGKMPIPLPAGVEVSIKGKQTTVKGSKGTLTWEAPQKVDVSVENNAICVSRSEDDKDSRALHGLTRALLNNMVIGVTTGFTRKLEIRGVGYSAKMQGKTLSIRAGYSHPVEVVIPDNLTVECPDATHIIVSGIDKQAVGQMAADIRKFRKPEPYKGKGILYEGEVVRRKAGKAFVGGGQ